MYIIYTRSQQCTINVYWAQRPKAQGARHKDQGPQRQGHRPKLQEATKFYNRPKTGPLIYKRYYF